ERVERGERGGRGGGGARGGDGRGGQGRAGAGARRGKAVPDADRRHLLDLGARDGSDGADRTRQGEGGRGSGDRGLPRDPQDGSDGRGDVQEAAGRRYGWGQRRAAAAGHAEGGRRAGDGLGQAGIDHAAHQVQGRGVRADEGGRRAAHAVLQGVSAAVLLPHDGRDRGGGAAERDGDGDAGGQRGSDDRADHAGGHGEGAAVCHPRRRTDGGSGNDFRNYSVGETNEDCQNRRNCQRVTIRKPVLKTV